jgi:hypothetical protein
MLAPGAALGNLAPASITGGLLAPGAALSNLTAGSITGALLAPGAALGNIGANGLTSTYLAYSEFLTQTGWISAEDHGFLPGNTQSANDTALAAVLAVANSTGKNILIGPGTFLLSQFTLPNVNGFRLEGMGDQATILNFATATTGPLITFPNHYFQQVAKIQIQAALMTSGFSFFVAAGNNPKISEISLGGPGNAGAPFGGIQLGVAATGSNLFGVDIRDIRGFTTGGDFINILGCTGVVSIINVNVSGQTAIAGSCCIRLPVAGDLDTLKVNHLYATGYSEAVTCVLTGATNRVSDCWFVDCVFDTMGSTNYGVQLANNGSAASLVVRFYFVKCWFGASFGIFITGNFPTQQIQFLAGCDLVSSYQNGILIQGSAEVMLDGCLIAGGGRTAPNTYPAVLLNSASAILYMQNCKAGAYGTYSGTFNYGVAVNSGQFWIVGNQLNGNGTGPMQFAGGTGRARLNYPVNAGNFAFALTSGVAKTNNGPYDLVVYIMGTVSNVVLNTTSVGVLTGAFPVAVGDTITVTGSSFTTVAMAQN